MRASPVSAAVLTSVLCGSACLEHVEFVLGDAGADAGGEPDAGVCMAPCVALPDAGCECLRVIAQAGGAFMMGCAQADAGCQLEEAPVHAVTLSPFGILATEVTQRQYGACVAAGACTPPAATCRYDPVARANEPVTCVHWGQADGYCRWAGMRLPTEAEWELAARPSGDRTPWGTAPVDCSRAVYSACVPAEPYNVGSKPAGSTPDGVADLLGNVEEWVQDWYDVDYYLASPATDPQGPATGTARGIRGGSYLSPAIDMRSSRRSGDAPLLNQNPNLGFRCAR